MIYIDNNTIINAFLGGVFSALEAAAPIIYPIIYGAIIIFFIKAIGRKIIEFVYFDYPQREIRRKKKIFGDLVDFLSSVSDIVTSDKNNK